MFYKKFQVSKNKIYSEIENIKGQNTNLNTIIEYLRSDYNLTLNNKNDLSLLMQKRAFEIEQKNKEQIKKDTETVLEWCKNPYYFDLLATSVIENVADLKLQGELQSKFQTDNFVIDSSPQYTNAKKELLDENGLIKTEIKGALRPLARRLITYSNLFKTICSNATGNFKTDLVNKYQNLVFECSKELKKSQIKLFIERFQFGLISEFVAKRGVSEFKKTQKVGTYIADKYLFQKDLKKWVLKQGVLGKKIFSESLFFDYQNRTLNEDITYPKKFPSQREFSQYLGVMFNRDTNKRIGKERCLILTSILSPKSFGASPKDFGVFTMFIKELKTALEASKQTKLEKSKPKNNEKTTTEKLSITIKEDQSSGHLKRDIEEKTEPKKGLTGEREFDYLHNEYCLENKVVFKWIDEDRRFSINYDDNINNLDTVLNYLDFLDKHNQKEYVVKKLPDFVAVF